MKKILRWLKALLRVSNTRYVTLENVKKIDDLETKIVQQQKKIDDLETKSEQQQKKIDDLETKSEQQQKKIDELYKQNYKSIKLYSRKLLEEILKDGL